VVTLLDVIEHADDDVGLCARRGHGSVRTGTFSSRFRLPVALGHPRRRNASPPPLYARHARTGRRAAGFVVRDLNHFNTLLFPLALVARWSAKLRNKQEAGDFAIPPAPVNGLLEGIFERRSIWSRRCRFRSAFAPVLGGVATR